MDPAVKRWAGSCRPQTMRQRIRRFFFPTITAWYLIRVCLVALFAYVFFGFLCTPFVIRGSSMEPTYRDGGFNFCWRPNTFFFGPKRYQVVVVRMAGEQVMLLKRVVALEGDEVEFHQGRLVVNGEEIVEPYLRTPCNWTLPPAGSTNDMSILWGTTGACPWTIICSGRPT